MEDIVLRDIGFINPSLKKIENFLAKLNKIPYSSPKKWEPFISDFFANEPFVLYFAERTTKKDSEELLNIIKYEVIKPLTIGTHFIDTTKIFKDLNNIYEGFKITPTIIKKHFSYFLFLSAVFRRMYLKKVDSEDSTFKNFHFTLQPSSWLMKSNEGELEFEENIYILSVDGSINLDYESIFKETRKKFSSDLQKLALPKKKINLKKRNPIESRLRHEVFKRDNYKCKECGKTNKESTLHCDHIVPVAQGGTDELENLQTLCQACNLAKSDKHWVGGKNA